MRLLNVDSKELHEIPDSTLTKTKYAILSHRWEEKGEITFRDLGNLDDPQWRTSYEKIDGCCRQAKADGLAWVWIDTCCINKDSSAELSEAINSMFRWYEDAEVCYVYLSDVPSGEIPWLPDSSFRKSLWFTRGWTLQELLAPRYKVFYDKNWSLIGAVHNSDYEIHCVEQLEVGHHPQKSLQRNSWRYLPNPSMPTVDLTDAIHETTGIDRQVITNNRKLYTVHAAEKMDWASCRKTTRPEDIAYCLLGIFGVNMPPLYGEGGRAFLRLQKEIIHNTYDHSIFSWGLGGYQLDSRDCPHWDFLARHPDAFRGFSRTINTFRTGGALKSESDISVFQTKRHYSLTNLGLQIELPLIPLNCASKEAGEDGEENSMSFALGLLDGPIENHCLALPLWILPKIGDCQRAIRCRGSVPFVISTATASLSAPKRSLLYLSEEVPLPTPLMSNIAMIQLDSAPGWEMRDYFPPSILMHHLPLSRATALYMEHTSPIILIRYFNPNYGTFFLYLSDQPISQQDKSCPTNKHLEISSGYVAITNNLKPLSSWEVLLSLTEYKGIDPTRLGDLEWGLECGFSSTSTATTCHVSLQQFNFGSKAVKLVFKTL